MFGVYVSDCRSSPAETQRNVNSTVNNNHGEKTRFEPYMVRLEDGKKGAREYSYLPENIKLNHTWLNSIGRLLTGSL